MLAVTCPSSEGQVRLQHLHH